MGREVGGNFSRASEEIGGAGHSLPCASRTASYPHRRAANFVVAAIAITLGLDAGTAWAQCPGAVHLSGDAALIEELSSALETRGTHVAPASACASAAVEVTAAGGRIRLSLEGAREPTVRELDRMTTAALLVESWTEAADVDLLEPATSPPVAAEPVVAESADGSVPIVTTPPVTPPSVTPPSVTPPSVVVPATPEPLGPSVVTVLARGEVAFGNDGSTWFGARLGACAHAGPTCIGGTLRYLADSGLSEGTISTGEQRVYLGVDADLAIPVVVAEGITLIPAVALGLGWLRITVVDGAQSVNADGLRALVTGSFGAAVSLVEWLALELNLAATWSPLAHTATWTFDGIAVDPDPIVFGSAMLGLRAEIR